MLYGAGAKVGFFQGDIRLLPDDMKTLQPTIFPVVPRLLNRVYDKVRFVSDTTASSFLSFCFKHQPSTSSLSYQRLQPFFFSMSKLLQVQSGAKSPFKKWLLNFAVERKFAEVREGIIRNNSIWDKLIFHKVQVPLLFE